MDWLSNLIPVLIVFTGCFVAMAIGLIVRGIGPRGGCGSDPEELVGVESCGSCPKKEIDLCEEDDTTGLAAVSNLSTLGRFEKDEL